MTAKNKNITISVDSFCKFEAGQKQGSLESRKNTGYLLNIPTYQPNFNFILDVSPEKQGIRQFWTLTKEWLD